VVTRVKCRRLYDHLRKEETYRLYFGRISSLDTQLLCEILEYSHRTDVLAEEQKDYVKLV
jgi:hypothetical protein